MRAEPCVHICGACGERSKSRRRALFQFEESVARNHTRHTPRKRGIQYAAACRLNHDFPGMLGGFNRSSRAIQVMVVIASEAKQSIFPRGDGWIASSLRSSQ